MPIGNLSDSELEYSPAEESKYRGKQGHKMVKLELPRKLMAIFTKRKN